MSGALNTSRNRYFDSRKNHTIFTPPPICSWLADILRPEIKTDAVILDPAVGSGNLLDPFSGVYKIGCDIEDFGADIDHFFEGDFLTWVPGSYNGIDMVVMNPPYNHSKESARKYGRSTLMPELFADQCFKLFGKDIKMIMFTPMGLRLNIRKLRSSQGERYDKMRDKWGQITSIVSLPLDVFPNSDFDTSKPIQRRKPKDGIMKSNILRKETQQEILFFNMPNLKPHYCLPESVLEELRDMDKELWK